MFTYKKKQTATLELRENQQKFTINLDYEYEDSDMLGILGVKLKDLNTSSVFIPDYPVGSSAISLTQYLKEEKTSSVRFGARTLLIPCNIEGYHWVGIIINFNNMNHITRIISIDSMNQESYLRIIKKALEESSTIYPELTELRLEEKIGWVQEDTVSCGPLTIENLLTIAKGNLLIPRIITKEELVEIRLNHINSYEPYCKDFYERQKYNINKIASFQQQYKWLNEAGSHFNVYELQGIIEVIRLIQGVKNPETKQNIMNALRLETEVHKTHLDHVREELFKINNTIQDEQDRIVFYSLLKKLLGIEPEDMPERSSFVDDDFKLPYEAIKIIVSSIDVNEDELYALQSNLHKQIEEDERFARNLQEELWEERTPRPPKVTQNSSSKFFNMFKHLALRIFKSNNRSLATVFGCLGGLTIGIILVVEHQVSIAIIGVPDSVAWDIVTVLLATGTGGNLSSYMGATVDILSNEKTIFDLIGSFCRKKPETKRAETKPEIEIIDGRFILPSETQRHTHFPFITSFENEAEENPSKNHEPRPGLFFYKNQFEKENKALRDENFELKRQLEELQLKMQVKIRGSQEDLTFSMAQ